GGRHACWDQGAAADRILLLVTTPGTWKCAPPGTTILCLFCWSERFGGRTSLPVTTTAGAVRYPRLCPSDGPQSGSNAIVDAVDCCRGCWNPPIFRSAWVVVSVERRWHGGAVCRACWSRPHSSFVRREGG
ncbi:unnamed protein product, partial [Ectocarpus sp. 8 AP-2014]